MKHQKELFASRLPKNNFSFTYLFGQGRQGADKLVFLKVRCIDLL
jgi:hypothetical protein